ncbi:MAG: phospholipase D [Elusimicrobia bacterium]|nr:MAG: phospholipase D [Elusimicrobiota bacterium]KAF0157473.1 MAG: phospholipase D [Elusimicrobiota bacterium]
MRVIKILLVLLLTGLSPALAAEITLVQTVADETVYGSTLAAKSLDTWVEMMDGASATLDIEQFYIAHRPGEPLETVLEAVKRAAARGVKVRIIVDKVMMGESAGPLKELGALENIEGRVIDYRKAFGGVQHAKFFIVDGREVFVGSQNFDWRALRHIHELGLRIKSERAAKTFSVIFEEDWAIAGGAVPTKKFARPDFVPVTRKKPEAASFHGSPVSYSLAFSPAKSRPSSFDTEIKELLRAIKKAKKSLSVQIMSYAIKDYDGTLWFELDKALRAAGRRGVEVRLIFADWTMGKRDDKYIKGLAKARNVSVKISSLPQHSGGFVPFARVEHCKYVVADGKVSVLSTSNWGKSYFYASRDAAVTIDGEAAAGALGDIFEAAWSGPYVEPVDQEKKYRAVKRN